MADLSKIKLNGTTYNFKDSQIRTNLNNLTTNSIGLALLDCSKKPYTIYINGVKFSSTGASDFSNSFLFMARNNTIHTGTITINGNLPFYNAQTGVSTGYAATSIQIYPNTETLQYGIVYLGYLYDGILKLYPLATKNDILTTTTITNTLSSGTLIATINGTNIYAPAYTDADGVSY